MNPIRVRVLRRALILCITIGLAEVTSAQEPAGICFLTVAKSQGSGNPERKNYVINDKAEWEELWEKVVANVSPKPPLPEIDFTRRTIIAVFEGSQPSGGFEITITNIVSTQGHIQVAVKELLGACVAPGIVTKPFHIVEVDKLDPAAIEFTLKQKVKKCAGNQ